MKNLQGWRMNQKVKALNIVCHGSKYQLMLPFHQTGFETSETNLGERFNNILTPRDRSQTHSCRSTLAISSRRAPWRLVSTLCRTIAEFSPSTKDEWEECVLHAHVKNQMVQSYGKNAHQHVFGKNRIVPANLLDEPLHLVPATEW